MRRFQMPILTVLILVLAQVSVMKGQGTPLKSEPAVAKADPADDEKELIELDKKWVEAAEKHDTVYLDQFFTDDFMEASAASGGEVSNKANLFKKVHASERKVESITVDDIHVHLYGDFAILTDRTVFKGTIGGRDISGDYRVMRVFVRQQGRWRGAGAELCRMAPSAYTSVHAESDNLCPTCLTH